MWKIQENSGYDLSDSSINSYNMSLVSVLTIRFLLPWIPRNASKTGWSYDLLETSPHPQFSGCLLTLFLCHFFRLIWAIKKYPAYIYSSIAQEDEFIEALFYGTLQNSLLLSLFSSKFFHIQIEYTKCCNLANKWINMCLCLDSTGLSINVV